MAPATSKQLTYLRRLTTAMDPDIFDLVYATATKETVIAPLAEADSPAAALERLTKASAGKFISAIVD